jgi:hypothetical protein
MRALFSLGRNQATPIAPWAEKYTRRGRGLTPYRVARIGRQVIEGLEFLYSKGLQYNNLHSGNVIMVDGVPR